MTKTTLTNNFHGTEYTTTKTRGEIDRILDTQPDDRTPAQRRWVTRVRRELCGINGCTCALNDLGER